MDFLKVGVGTRQDRPTFKEIHEALETMFQNSSISEGKIFSTARPGILQILKVNNKLLVLENRLSPYVLLIYNIAEVEKELEKNSVKKPPPMLPTKRREDKVEKAEKRGKSGKISAYTLSSISTSKKFRSL